MVRADDLAGLARAAGVDADGLVKTVARFNEFAAAGRDEDFGRGDSAYDRYYGDPRLANPNLAPLARPPFYAVKIVPGDLGTKGGLRTDERARVLRPGRHRDRGPVRRGQRERGGDGPQLRGRGRDHRPGHDVRLHRRAHHGGRRRSGSDVSGRYGPSGLYSPPLLVERSR